MAEADSTPGLPYAKAVFDDGVYAVVCPRCGTHCVADSLGDEDSETKGANAAYRLHFEREHGEPE